jgi:hypothetical protein
LLRIFYYLVVLTIARRCAPFANCKDTLVSLELIGENFTILPVTPVLLVVNKSPIWYVYPPSVMIFLFCYGGWLSLFISCSGYFDYQDFGLNPSFWFLSNLFRDNEQPLDK